MEHVVLVMCGAGSSSTRLKDLAQGLDNMIWIPLQPVPRLNELLNLADIHLLPQRRGVADSFLPSKLTGILASGRPVIAAADRGTQLESVLSGVGCVVTPGDLEGFVSSLASLSEDANRRHELGLAARKFALDNFDKNTVLEGFERGLQDCAAFA